MHRNYEFLSGVVKDLTYPKSYHSSTSLLALIPLYSLTTPDDEALSKSLQLWSMSLLHFLHSYTFIHLFCFLTSDSIRDFFIFFSSWCTQYHQPSEAHTGSLSYKPVIYLRRQYTIDPWIFES